MEKKSRIMIVEDELIVVTELVAMLKKHGYELTAAVNSGPQALEAVALNVPDLILMDINLGRSIDGIETSDLIRNEYQIPIVYMTAYADRETINRAKASNPFGYIVKPMDHNQIVATIEIALTMGRLDAQYRRQEKELKKVLTKSDRRAGEVSALLEGARSIMDQPNFKSAALGLFNACKKAIGATAGYVALLSEDGAENKVLFLDSGGLVCSVDPELPMPIRGLRSEAYLSGNAVYDNNFSKSKWWALMPSGHVLLENVMFVPIIIQGKAVGLIGLANCPEGFDDQKARLASAFGEMAAVSLRESRVKEEREMLISELKAALKEIKTLRGIIPICSNCKKIRDDDGFWYLVEKYVQDHSEAQFTHGICPDCVRKLYPDFSEK